jgi:hypothetical protein
MCCGGGGRKRGSKGGGRRKIGKHNTRFVMVYRLLKEDRDHKSASPRGGGGRGWVLQCFQR